ncbi:MAG: 2-hydroxyacyl-CoA dehydratase family protein [Desulfobacterales bacterium]|jgi:benzoyl-CoA reductase/2-hydroxyglutaryl-CoA dehydratase subunit BcrC/BadD/HgdB
MKEAHKAKIGYACAYTPLVLLDAAGYTPYRILPMSDCPDQAGQLLHDNLCPHVKRILDRAIAKDLPDLEGMVLMNSCDAMRRLADAWSRVRPKDHIELLDLPATADDAAVAYFTGELKRLNDALSEWCGHTITHRHIAASVARYNKLPPLFNRLRESLRLGQLTGGSVRMQTLYNAAMSLSFDNSLATLEQALAEPQSKSPEPDGIPVFLFGNVLADPEALRLFESCGARIIEDDLCTGSRLFTTIEFDESQDALPQISRSLLTRPPCARTFDPAQPLKMAEDILDRAQASGADGVIGQTIKFCDPYLDRLPAVRETLRQAGIPLLLLEGDCSLRTIEQQRTRIEAFIEMLN